jgi:predicted nuclease with TOPRIM domain
VSDNVLDYLREQFARLHVKLDHITSDVIEVKERLGLLEGGYASLSRRVDRLGGDIERIKVRLELVDAP